MFSRLLQQLMRGTFVAAIWIAMVEAQPPERSTVRDALTQQAGQDVTVEGVVLRRLGPNSYLIHDGTAAVEVELSEGQTPLEGLAPNTRIRIRGGLVIGDDDTVEIDVDRISYSF